MRRTAAVAMTVVALGAGVGLTAAPAGAAPKKVTKKWSTFQGKKELRSVHAAGTYTRSGKHGKKIVIRGRITDKARNGWTPGIQFRVYDNGKWTEVEPIGIFRTPGRTPLDASVTVPARNKPQGKFKTLKGTRLQVREIAISMGEKKPVVGGWKKIF